MVISQYFLQLLDIFLSMKTYNLNILDEYCLKAALMVDKNIAKRLLFENALLKVRITPSQHSQLLLSYFKFKEYFIMFLRVFLINFWLLSGLVLPIDTDISAQDQPSEPDEKSKSYNQYTDSLVHKPGLVNLYLDEKAAKVYLGLQKSVSDEFYGHFIYAPALSGGLGSNFIGLDRALSGDSQLLRFRRVGKKIFAEIENSHFRAISDNPAERGAVDRSFAHSIIWSTDIIAESRDGEVLIDFSEFIMRDAIGIAKRLKERGQGNFTKIDALSYVRMSAALSFETNAEFDAVLTFSSDDPGSEVTTTAPDPRKISLIHHTSLMKLPEAGYKIRRYDERAGVIGGSYINMAASLDRDVVTRLARRFRLQKNDQGIVVNPIIFYVDNGAPAPIRDALIEGAGWWSKAFDAAGFPGGYRVEVLPENVHPLDARYNVINWVHRSTRGWSYGAALYDPRTYEALRGIVILGSLRVRQDIKIFEALMGADKTGSGIKGVDPIEIALDRIKQLSAHEVGHTLGFAHNMAGSSYGDRESVMDYPAPDIKLSGDKIDATNAYAKGIGDWDMFTVNFLYGDYGDQSDALAQAELIKDADQKGLIYVSDFNSRNAGTGHARGAIWDNGSDPVQELSEIMALRRFALDRFGSQNLRPDEDFSQLQTKIVPLYLYHRYQVEAVSKLIAGSYFTYSRKGDNRPYMRPVSKTKQAAALNALIKTLSVDALSLKPDVIRFLSPTASDYYDPQFDRESFSGKADPDFDLSAAAGTAVDTVLNTLLHPRRLARLEEQSLLKPELMDLSAYLALLTRDLITKSRDLRGETGQDRLLKSVVEERFVTSLIDIMASARTSMSIRAEIRRALKRVLKTLERRSDAGADHLQALINDRFSRDKTPAFQNSIEEKIPPGSPIGAETCWHGC